MPAWLEAAILRALAVEPGDRFADVEELIHLLESGSAVAVPAAPRTIPDGTRAGQILAGS